MRPGRLRAWTAGWGTACLTGAISFLVVGRISSQPVVPMLLVGALYGLGVLGILRLFPVHRWGLAVAGILAGPVPAALLMGGGGTNDDRGGAILATVVLGLLVGLLEWARQARALSDANES